MNPLDWNGQQFLAMYGPFLLFAFLGAVFWKKSLNQPTAAPKPHELDLDPYLVAALEGDDAAVKAAVVSLVHGGALRFEDEKLSVANALPVGASRLERAVHAAVAESRSSLGAGD